MSEHLQVVDLTEPGPGLRALLREDWETHRRSILMPGLHALALHRVGVWARARGGPAGKAVGVAHKLLTYVVMRNLYGIEIAPTAVIGRRVCIGHHQGVVIGYATVVGDDCVIRQGVTLGGQSDDVGKTDNQPVVGCGVHFGAGATVIGKVRIGDGARIGPGAVVTTNVPAGATAFATPARILKAPQPA